MKTVIIGFNQFQINSELMGTKTTHELENDLMYFKIGVVNGQWKVVKALSKTKEGVIDDSDKFVGQSVIFY